MSRYKKMKFKEENNGASGEFPEHGAIFMSNSYTRKECLRRGLFGLPMFQSKFVEHVKAGMFLFLFEFESRELHGVFQAISDGAMNIESDAFSSTGKQFPAQVKFAVKWRCRPLHESEFGHAIFENYFTARKFNFGLSKAQVQRLLKLFSSNKIERPSLRKSAEAKPTRKHKRDWRNRPRDRDFIDHYTEETDGELGYRPTENYGSKDESDMGLESEYSINTSSRFHKRLVYPKTHRSRNEKDGIKQESWWSDHKEHLKMKTELVVASQISVPVESPCGTTVEGYDPCYPGFTREATMRISRHDLVCEPNVDTMGYVTKTLPSETEHNGGVMDETSIPGFDDDYIPMPTEYLEYRIKTGMIKAPEKDRKEKLNIFPSFANPLSSRALSPTDNVVNNETSSYQHKEEFEGQASYSNRVEGYQGHQEFGRDAYDSKESVKHFVDPSEFERNRTRKSVFSRLSMPLMKRAVEKDTELGNTVMAFLNDCNRHCSEPKLKEEIHREEVLGGVSMSPYFQTSPDDLLCYEESMGHVANPTLECNDGSKDSALEDKTMNLLRPELAEVDSEKDIGGSIENFSASRLDNEVHFHDFLGLGDQ